MKSNIAIALGIAFLIIWGVYSLYAYEGYESQQGLFLIPFGVIIGIVFYISTRPRIGR
jgi:glucose-6-phosphate-specific signal transduction histidine kinase